MMKPYKTITIDTSMPLVHHDIRASELHAVLQCIGRVVPNDNGRRLYFFRDGTSVLVRMESLASKKRRLSC